MAIRVALLLLLLPTLLFAADTDIFDAEVSSDTIPQVFQTSGIYVFTRSNIQAMPGVVSSIYASLGESNRSFAGASFMVGGMSAPGGSYAVACFNAVFKQYIIGHKKAALFAQAGGGLAQGFSNPFRSFSSVQLEGTGYNASAWLGFQFKIGESLLTLQIMGGYVLMSLEERSRGPAMQFTVVM